MKTEFLCVQPRSALAKDRFDNCIVRGDVALAKIPTHIFEGRNEAAVQRNREMNEAIDMSMWALKYMEDGQILMDVTHDVRGNFVRIIVDSESVLTLDDTAKLTRSIKNASETLSEFPDGVRIEVSTPGLDWSLSEPFQYKKNLNRKSRYIKYLFMNGLKCCAD